MRSTSLGNHWFQRTLSYGAMTLLGVACVNGEIGEGLRLLGVALILGGATMGAKEIYNRKTK